MNKKHLMASIALLCVTVLAGCSKNAPSGAAPSDPRAIRLSAGLQVSKAAVKDGSTFTAAVAGWESETTANYETKRTWQTSSTITASASAGAITLGDAQFYSQNSAVKTYIRAWYPAGTLADDGLVTFGGTADGTLDVLLADEVWGSALESQNDPKTLAFQHPLTQLKFTVQGDVAFGTTTKVNAITIKNVGVPIGLDLKSSAVSYMTMVLNTPGINGTQAITTTKAIVGEPAMIQPITGSTFMIDVTTSDATYTDVTVTVTDSDLKAGKAYTIALNFVGIGVTAQASVTPWDDSGVGSGDVNTKVI